MTYAQILNGIIVNIIDLEDSTLVPIFAQGFDSCLQIDNLSTVPDIGWYYDISSAAFYSPATLALIQDNLVVSVIQNCAAYITNNSSSYQYIINVTGASTMPQVGWSFSGTAFTPSMAYYQELVTEATAFGNQLILQFAAQNVASGITQAGQTLNVLNYADALNTSLSSGSLYVAIAQIEAMIADTSSTKTSLSPFITNDILYSYLNQIQTWLEIPLTQNPGP
jgi:hypothetical protein